ncbi:PREDICTED: uncharacterized protein LOC109333882 [Lupinus angustifolius]|uniref:uncharacterized protein LOC109333882 n=1 Tax=Lupinus angustifolius TaxID=3871 RepID=UPI00092EF29C|nr:PREDICTED: uncharacterized protein LOC109333882 [Lupinus angustifolius]
MGANFQSKPISWISILCSIILLLTYFTTPSLSASTKYDLNPYDILLRNNLPKGLLPVGAITQHFDGNTGKCTFKLNHSCTYKIDGNYLKFESTVSAIISSNSISNVEGVKLKIVSQWVSITKVNRIQDQLKFAAGNVARQSLVHNFNVSPSRCADV